MHLFELFSKIEVRTDLEPWMSFWVLCLKRHLYNKKYIFKLFFIFFANIENLIFIFKDFFYEKLQKTLKSFPKQKLLEKQFEFKTEGVWIASSIVGIYWFSL